MAMSWADGCKNLTSQNAYIHLCIRLVLNQIYIKQIVRNNDAFGLPLHSHVRGNYYGYGYGYGLLFNVGEPLALCTIKLKLIV